MRPIPVAQPASANGRTRPTAVIGPLGLGARKLSFALLSKARRVELVDVDLHTDCGLLLTVQVDQADAGHARELLRDVGVA
jgi:hypothetical protein